MAMNIVFYGNRQAGLVGLLTALASGHLIEAVYTDTSESQEMFHRATGRFPISLPSESFGQSFADPLFDVLLCVHGRRKIAADILEGYALGGVNVHPFLKEFPGANPVGRALEGATMSNPSRVMTVSSHQMTEDIDAGPEIYTARGFDLMPFRRHIIFPANYGPGGSPDSEITELMVDATYNALYPLYAECVTETLKLLEEKL